MKRLQRLRSHKFLRDLTSEVDFNKNQLIQPLFCVENLGLDEPIKGLKGVLRHSQKGLLQQIESDLERGVRHFLLFHVPQSKLSRGFNHDGASKVIRSIKEHFKSDLFLWLDTCLCSMTDHGHCCIFHENGKRDHDETLRNLASAALAYAAAGADGVSPSDMMDGRVSFLRKTLDEEGHVDVPIMSYSTKFASQFYGPFRNAASSAPQFGDRSSYQIDVRNRTDALAASVRCAEEGADLLMVKPAMTSLDLIQPIYEATRKPVGAYQVSGEYASLALLEEAGLIHFEKALLESWQVLKRGGAQFIISYGARLASSLEF